MNERPKDCDSCRFRVVLTNVEPDEPSNLYCGNMCVSHTYILDAKKPPCGGDRWHPY